MKPWLSKALRFGVAPLLFAGWLLAGAGLVPHVAAGLMFLFVLLLTLLQLGAVAPAYGWVDVAIALAAVFVITRWMPAAGPTGAKRK